MVKHPKHLEAEVSQPRRLPHVPFRRYDAQTLPLISHNLKSRFSTLSLADGKKSPSSPI